MSDVRWAYAINQWDTNIDSFVRKREHERAFKTASISGFPGVELTAESFGAWEPLGTPQQLADLYGSVEKFGEFLSSCAIEAVSSYVYDPAVGFEVEMGRGPDPLDPASVEQIVRTARWFADALRRLGGSVLVVRAAPSAWQTGALSAEQIDVLARLWNAVGEAIAADGIALGLHVDFLSALRLDDGISRLLEATDAEKVGLAIDTAELAIAGIDPVALYRRHADRVVHVQLKDARETVDDAEASTPHAEQFIRTEGGARKILRWFYEPSDERALVDFEGFVGALAEHGYRGWIVVESDQSPHPAESTMVAGWYVQKVLRPILEGARVAG
ncbi:sugar phosphate isomerase/epimerase family protein [Microbacterium testaceum]|uniref:sugar phosphate isomerase/epimerase family protein n=1 Tax=Microbacterium testaceum TaxID=2033 RepID=UPI002AC6FD90|nr:sugar phosphate isomerase/epimerase [Microbacterium testaceum]MDZ5145229.1 sugar phosphate isomerase/epimerase [Microbacterium testaceum]